MSDYDEDQQYDDESEGIKNLRKAHKELKAQLAAATEELGTYKVKARTSSLSELLGANAKFAKFYPADTEATEENVKAWVEENAELFGFTQPEADADQEQIAAAKRIADASGGTPDVLPSTPEAIIEQMKSAGTAKELAELLAGINPG